MIIENARLSENSAVTLSTLQRKHIEALFDFEQENRVWFEQSVPPRPESYRQLSTFRTEIEAQLLEQALGRYYFFVLENQGRIVGRVNLYDLSATRAEVGYRVGQAVAGQGLMSKAIACLVTLARQELKLNQLIAKTTLNNLPSIAVLEKSGFVQTKICRDTVTLNGKTQRMIFFELPLR
ncbi:GNAT family N-acetyltransferase (plasmid) [Photobacterium sp. GJ3]|uniref:GNAT family N-acetyltransferase n=1 Tax=Photobacterium sp. GJ3 TaxID=2829502 RepID=UPI001B8BFF2F|nr:GNAT family protein [Photobacterium sp. GJ3]QUJ69796.1 GNAT family N-acetyltransferase [Photobacterium sp. GJ3]